VEIKLLYILIITKIENQYNDWQTLNSIFVFNSTRLYSPFRNVCADETFASLVRGTTVPNVAGAVV